MSFGGRRLCVLMVLSSLVCMPSLAKAVKDEATIYSEASLKKPAMIQADKMYYDRAHHTVKAQGNVEIVQGARMLLADSVIYYQKSGLMLAKGHVSLLEPDGTVLFANEVELRDALKEGVISGFSARFNDGSVLAANEASRDGKGVTTLDKVVYSPCPVCNDEQDEAPLWQVKSNKATIDENKERVYYKHSFLELKGVPVMYTPYFSHPTPNAKRKSGFLTPKYKNDSIFGTTITTPFYYNISPDKDITLTPSYTSDEGVIMSGNYRQLFESGKVEFTGSITNPNKVNTAGNHIDGRELRSHIEGQGDFDINETVSWGFVGKRASDDTYLKRYQFGDEDVLTSKLFSEYIDGRNYGLVQALSFQGLKSSDDPGTTPLILPQVDFHWEKEQGHRGAKWLLDTNALILSRDEGVNSRRVSVKGGWSVPYVSDQGHSFKLITSLRGDLYSVEDVPLSNNDSRLFDGGVARGIPQAELLWSLPLLNKRWGKRFFLEPTANIIVSPYGGNSEKIPNEDSQDVEFSNEALFDENHFVGFDRVESGPRTNYGVRGGIEGSKMGRINFLFGQRYSVKRDINFDANSGLNDNFSDYVGRLGYQSGGMFDISYRFRFDKDSLSPQRNAINADLDISPFQLNLDYLALDERFANDGSVGSEREIMLATMSVDVTKDWTFSANGHRDIEDGEWISSKLNLLYSGACVDFVVSWFEEFTVDRDIRPNTTVSFQLSLKNIGY